MGYFGEEFSDTFWDKADTLPGGYIIQREIKRAIAGEPFFYNDEETGKPVRCDAVSQVEFSYYVNIWSNYHHFGLPHGRGWAAERQWLLDFLRIFEGIFDETQAFYDNQMRKKAELKAGSKHGRDQS